jgi:hypothetical protein
LLNLPIREVLAKVVHQSAAAHQATAQSEIHEGDHILHFQRLHPLFEAIQFTSHIGTADKRANRCATNHIRMDARCFQRTNDPDVRPATS